MSDKETFLAVIRDDGNWLIVSHDQSPKSVVEMKNKAVERGCRLVRLPLAILEGLSMGPVDLSEAEEVVDG